MRLYRGCVKTAEDLDAVIRHAGFLPFFHTPSVLSLEDLASPSVWFTSMPGPWEWKGELAREKRCVYGKFANKGAAFVAVDIFPDLINIRRDGYDYEGFWEDGLAGRTGHDIYQYVSEHGPSESRHIRRALGKPRDYDRDLILLQMQTFLVPVDFVQDLDRTGKPYGWGNSVMDTPEHAFGEAYTESCSHSQEESLKLILERMKDITTGDATDLILGRKTRKKHQKSAKE